MKLFATFLSYKRLFLFISICAFVVQTSNSMMRSTQQREIAARPQAAAEKRKMQSLVWVKTSDDYVVSVEKWKIDQMKLLQVLFVHQKGTNSNANPIIKPEGNYQWITSQELLLISNAFDAVSQGQFEQFYTNIGDADVVRKLINSAGKVEATGLSALCGTYVFPKEIQQQIISHIMSLVADFVEWKNIKRKSLNPNNFASVGFSPDSTKIASGGWTLDNRLCVFNSQTGKQLLNLVGHSICVYSVAFSPDGTKIVSGGDGDQNNLFVWDAQTGDQVFNLAGHNDLVKSVAFSPDGTKIVSGGDGNQNNLFVWDAQTGDQLFNLVGHGKGVKSIAFSPDGTKIVSGGDGNQNNLFVWDAQTGDQLFNLAGHNDLVNSVAFSPDGKKIVSGSYETQNNLFVWDAQTGDQVFNLKGHNLVYSVAFSPNGAKIVSAGERKKNNLFLWDAHTGNQLVRLKHDGPSLQSAAFSPDGTKIVSCGKKLILWKLPIDLIKAINNLDIHQVRLLYQMYMATVSGSPMFIKIDSFEYVIYQTLPDRVKQAVIKAFDIKIEKHDF